MIINRLVIHSDAVRGTYGVLAAVALANSVLLVDSYLKVPTKFFVDFLGQLGETIFLQER